jgi:hypothetical protein
MIYMKHATLGNQHFEDAEEKEKAEQGWVKWPRTAEQKNGVVEQVEKVARPRLGRPPKVAVVD